MDTIKYYESFYTYNHPVKLSGELSLSQKEQMDTYLITTWNSGNLMKVEKILRNKFFFSYEYFYNEKNKLQKVIVTNEEGEKKYDNILSGYNLKFHCRCNKDISTDKIW